MGQTQKRNIKQEIIWLKTSLEQHHVAPKIIDDSFSYELFDKILLDLDPDKIFFTKSDLVVLEPYRNMLDDEINGKRTTFLDRLKEQYKGGIVRAEKLITSTLASPLDWKTPERYDPKADWVTDDTALGARHRQWLKYQILDRLVELKQRDSIHAGDFFQKHIKQAIAHVELTALRPIKRFLNDPLAYDNEISNAFLQAMASVFDPHSAFFSMTTYDDFVGALSTEDFVFGFMLDEDENGNVVISALSPGGAAWKSGALHVSDIVVAVKWPDEDPVDLKGMDIDDVNELLSASHSDVLVMTVQTLDGNEKQVTLRKEKMETEQNVVQSFILKGEIRAGYIYLPDFYTRWDDEQEGGRCANDVAKEIIRLKKEGIDGIILDLRFNGGGSLFEARAMAGIFIDEGPLAMFTTRDKKPHTLKDVNRGTVYDGPLVLMVNGASASASEVLAAAIQDYHRGLIVGSRTYGKATGQNVFPLEGVSVTPPTTRKGKSGAGYVKVTTQKLFRVTGKSAQGIGVAPDIEIPDAFSVLKVSESKSRFTLSRDSILMNPYYKPLLPLKTKELRAQSNERLINSKSFQELRKTIAWMEEVMRMESQPQPLQWETYLAMINEQEKRNTAMETFKSSEKVFDVSNNATKTERLAVDEYARELNDRWLQVLTSDISLQETYLILRDQINMNKKQ